MGFGELPDGSCSSSDRLGSRNGFGFDTWTSLSATSDIHDDDCPRHQVGSGNHSPAGVRIVEKKGRVDFKLNGLDFGFQMDWISKLVVKETFSNRTSKQRGAI